MYLAHSSCRKPVVERTSTTLIGKTTSRLFSYSRGNEPTQNNTTSNIAAPTGQFSSLGHRRCTVRCLSDGSRRLRPGDRMYPGPRVATQEAAGSCIGSSALRRAPFSRPCLVLCRATPSVSTARAPVSAWPIPTRPATDDPAQPLPRRRQSARAAPPIPRPKYHLHPSNDPFLGTSAEYRTRLRAIVEAPIAAGCVTGEYGSKRRAVASPGAGFGVAGGMPGSMAGTRKLANGSTVA